MCFSVFEPGKSGNPEGAKAGYRQVRSLLHSKLSKEEIVTQLAADFKEGNQSVRDYIYQLTLGKPEQVNINQNENTNIDRIEITLIPHEDKKQIAEVSKNQIVVKPIESQVSVKQIQHEGNQ